MGYVVIIHRQSPEGFSSPPESDTRHTSRIQFCTSPLATSRTIIYATTWAKRSRYRPMSHDELPTNTIGRCDALLCLLRNFKPEALSTSHDPSRLRKMGHDNQLARIGVLLHKGLTSSPRLRGVHAKHTAPLGFRHLYRPMHQIAREYHVAFTRIHPQAGMPWGVPR